MVTPEEARKIAKEFDEYYYSSPQTKGASYALRDLAAQVEALQADAERYR